MVVKIHPAVLAANIRTYHHRLGIAKRLSSEPHLDIRDGVFVSGRSLTKKQLAKLSLPTGAEIHLMVDRPQLWLDAVAQSGAKNVIIHIESNNLASNIADACRHRKINLAWAINPNTPLLALNKYLAYGRRIHVLNGRPGKYGRPIDPVIYRRIRFIHQRWPKVVISCDIGVTPQTIGGLIKAGVSSFGVGSYILKADDPRGAVRRLQAAARKSVVK